MTRRVSRLFCLSPSPIVEINVVEKASSEKRNSIQVLPTPESPMRSSLNSRSYVFFAISAPGVLYRVVEQWAVGAAAAYDQVNRTWSVRAASREAWGDDDDRQRTAMSDGDSPRRADASYIERNAPVILAQGRTRARLPTGCAVYVAI